MNFTVQFQSNLIIKNLDIKFNAVAGERVINQVRLNVNLNSLSAKPECLIEKCHGSYFVLINYKNTNNFCNKCLKTRRERKRNRMKLN